MSAVVPSVRASGWFHPLVACARAYGMPFLGLLGGRWQRARGRLLRVLTEVSICRAGAGGLYAPMGEAGLINVACGGVRSRLQRALCGVVGWEASGSERAGGHCGFQRRFPYVTVVRVGCMHRWVRWVGWT